MSGTPADHLDQITVCLGRLHTLVADIQHQAADSRQQLHAAREREEARFRRSMDALFQEHRQRMELALRPAIVRAWQVVAAAAGILVLVFAGSLLLLNQANERLHAAQARAEAAEVDAQVLEAARHVEISSCGGRPCIRIDRDVATWENGGREYVLVGQ